MEYAFHRFEVVTSTNDLAVAMAEKGAPEGTVVVAEEQVAGRGRRGRHWVSPPDCGVYLSVLLRPEIPRDRFWHLAFVASLAAAEGIRWASRLDVHVKWPNDVLINGRKVCGILVEARKPSISFEPVAVLGVGVNVNTVEFPPELAETATSIAREAGAPVQRQAVERGVLDALATRYEQYRTEGFRPILNMWKDHDCTVGRDVTVHSARGPLEGTAVEVNARGSLILRLRDGSLEEITTGEVLFSA